jgi:hypothetical protein
MSSSSSCMLALLGGMLPITKASSKISNFELLNFVFFSTNCYYTYLSLIQAECAV